MACFSWGGGALKDVVHTCDEKLGAPTPGEKDARAARAVSIAGGARLHFGFADPSGAFGRRYGSIGLAIDRPNYEFHFRRGKSREARDARTPENDPDAPSVATSRLLTFASRVRKHHGYSFDVAVTVRRALAGHAGLGSGTQLAIAAGVATRLLAGDSANPYALAQLLGRGLRSSIGAAAFDSGGFIVDGGRRDTGDLAPIIARQPFPEDWAIILVGDRDYAGLSADTEIAAFDDLPSFKATDSAEICRALVLQALPSIAVRDIENFGAAISRIQEITGDYFAPHQGGQRFTSARVADIVGWLLAQGAHGSGQSSWGPTGYAFCVNRAVAEGLVRRLMAIGVAPGIEIDIAHGRNHGARVDVDFDGTLGSAPD